MKITTSNSVYRNINSALGISIALDNLVMAAKADHDIITKLTITNTNLTEVVKTLTDQLGVTMRTI